MKSVTKLSLMNEMRVKCIHNVICFHTGVTEELLISNSRKRFVVDARAISIHQIRQYTRLSLGIIGGLYNKDHSSINHMLKRYDIISKDYNLLKETISKECAESIQLLESNEHLEHKESLTELFHKLGEVEYWLLMNSGSHNFNERISQKLDIVKQIININNK